MAQHLQSTTTMTHDPQKILRIFQIIYVITVNNSAIVWIERFIVDGVNQLG